MRIRTECPCGASFEAEDGAHQSGDYALTVYHSWQDEHALVCEVMALMARPRQVRERERAEELRQLEEKQRTERREKAIKAKAYRQARNAQ